MRKISLQHKRCKNTLLQHFTVSKYSQGHQNRKHADTREPLVGGYYYNTDTTHTVGKSADDLFSNLIFNLSNSNTNYTKTI